MVTRCRNRTVANGDSIKFDVRRCRQCSAGKAKKASNASWSSTRHAVTFGYLTSNSATKTPIAFSASALVGAYMISRSARFARGRSRFGSLSSTLASLCTSRVARSSPATRPVPRTRGPARRHQPQPPAPAARGRADHAARWPNSPCSPDSRPRASPAPSSRPPSPRSSPECTDGRLPAGCLK